jgi:phage baseplate assembly protein W
MSFYRDINESLPKQTPDLFDVNSIVQNVKNLVLTEKGTRLFDPDYGITLESKLFDLMSDVSALDIFNEVVRALDKYEPRVLLVFTDSGVEADPDTNTYNLKLSFKIKGFGDQIFTVTEALTG